MIDAAGMALVPGLVNGHTHAAMTLFRGHGDDRPLMEWLEEVIWPVEARLDDEDVYWGTRLACAEMIRTGTVRFWDMYWRAGAVARAVEDAGLRATIGVTLSDVGDAAGEGRLRDRAERALEEIGEPRRARPACARPARDLHGQRAVASLDRRGRRRAGDPGSDPPLRDRGRGDPLRRRSRRPTRPSIWSGSGCSARGRCSRMASGWTRPSWS